MRKLVFTFGMCAIGLLLAVAGGMAQAPLAAFRTKFPRDLSARPCVLVAAKVKTPPTIDGEVDRDPVWQACGCTEGVWTQLGTKTVSARQTAVYCCYDDANLYFGFVCEEPELQNVVMDGTLTQAFQPAGPDDCVEAIIEIGGVQGDGEVYAFRANSRAQLSTWGLTGIITEFGYHVPAWKHAGKFGPNRWMLEMAIPFSTIKRLPQQKGLRTPARGDVWGLKLVRWGAQQQDPRNRMVSTWNTNIVAVTPYIAGGDGLLCFDDANSISDGNFAAPPEKSPWKREGPVEPAAAGGVTLSAGARLSQALDLHPGGFYRLTAEGAGDFGVSLDGKDLALKDGRAGFWTVEAQEKATLSVTARGAATLKRMLVEYQPGEKPAGTWCLTGNYRHADRNIRALAPDAPDGCYRYVYLDYQNRVAADGNPSFRIGGESAWAYDYNLRVEDVGGKEGWIPFGKGSLTGRPEAVFWQTWNPSDYACWGRMPRVVDIDLGREYFVRGLDVLWAAPNIINFEVWGKLKQEDDWTLLSMDSGTFVEKSKRRTERRAWESLSGLDSVVRFLRWRATQMTGERQPPQMDGIQEFWVWGEPAGTRAGIKPFEPWVPKEGAAPVQWTTTAPDPDACLIYPRPRRWEKTDGWFVVTPRTRIVAQNEAEARKVAGQIHDEIRERWRLEVPVEEELADAGALRTAEDVIYVGRPSLSAPAAALLGSEGLTIEPNKPQAYALRATRRRVVVLGADAEGLYWGVQSLMMAMRWHSSKDPSQDGLGVRCMKVEDWPATLDRSIFFTEGTIFSAIESEIPRAIRNVKLQSRFKWNGIYSDVFEPALAWQPGRVAEVCREARERCHVEIRPMLLEPPAIYLGGWNNVVAEAKDLSVVEHDPDEAPEDLGCSLNLCPLKPRTYDLVFARIDRLLEEYAWPGRIWLGGLVCHDPASGSRWAVCRDCVRSGKTKDELYAYFAGRVAQHLKDRRATGVLEPTNVAFGDRTDARWKRSIVVADARTLPADFEYILPPGFSTAKEESLDARLRSAATAEGSLDRPSVERFFRAPMGTDLGTIGRFDETWHTAAMVRTMEEMWYGPDKRPAGNYDFLDLRVWGNSWHFRRDLPSWRAGDRPGFVPLDLRPFANHSGQATGVEPLEPGRPPAIDLRYVPSGRLVLSGVAFDLIDPATNNGKSVLMLGRPIPGVTKATDLASVSESAGPIPVGRKLASIAFLHAGWEASTQPLGRGQGWLHPVCRVMYEDDTWLVADSFRIFDEWDYWNMSNGYATGCPMLLERVGWMGNSPGGSTVQLKVNEWVNPYPEKAIQCLRFVTPAYEGGEDVRRMNPQCRAFVAITGIEPIEQDFRYWSRRPDRLALLPPEKPRRFAAEAIKHLWEYWPGGRASVRAHGPAGDLTTTFDTTPSASYTSGWSARSDIGMLFNNTDYRPFGVVEAFDPPLRLCRVDVRGPNSSYGHDHEYSLGRGHRLDVKVEISEDGETWRAVGAMKGLSGDADFQSAEFEPVVVKKVRLTGDAGPYHEEYAPGMANPIAVLDFPHFVWRLYAPTDKAAP